MIPRYLIDNDTLSRMSPAQRASEFVRIYCRVPTEVLEEAAGYIEPAVREAIEYTVTVEVLDNLRRVMATLAPGDRSVVDLYSNKGTGDAMLLAVALTEQAIAENHLVPENWIIATGDNALTAKAKELGVETVPHDNFLHLVSGT